MTHTTVLTGGRFVLKHHVEFGAVLLVLVWPAHQVDYLITLDSTGAREHGKGADTGEVIHFESADFAIVVDGNARMNAVVSGVDVTGERLQPVRHKLNRAPQQHGQRYGGKVIRVGVHFDTE